eukprot:CAMPEP_0180660192 /NCGR_PEP_ID=MMETSP1037_2-20121125/58085_1 /TAXON_ID=632150 /ORGANISM="Azadinium spinosum, Strain 3D9" /LENGTH=43 /DNA_ID= /DNA_START= /DNA_END= /DNA_ORIENTATION=
MLVRLPRLLLGRHAIASGLRVGAGWKQCLQALRRLASDYGTRQ